MAVTNEREGRMDKYLGWKINETVLVAIILSQIFDFFNFLGPFWTYIKNVISWALVVYLLYSASPSEIIFGERHRLWDAAAITAFFALSLKTVVGFAESLRAGMLDHVLDYVSFFPGNAPGAIPVNVSQAAYNAFTVLHIFPDTLASYANALATHITLINPAIPFALTAGNQTAGALLQPYGLDGLTFQLYNTLVLNAAVIETAGFILGGLLILCLTVYAAFRFRAAERSVLHVLGESGEAGGRKTVLRTLAVLLAMAAFFVLIFNLFIEWLAIAVDAPLTMIGIAFYLLLLLRSHRLRHEGIDRGGLLLQIGNFGNDFIKGFFKLFQDRKTVLLGLSGLLVFHLLTDIGAYLLPFMTGWRGEMYFGQLGAGHDPLYAHLFSSFGASWQANAAFVLLYALNALGLLVLLGLPAYIWYKSYRIRTRPDDEDERKHHPSLPAWAVALSLASVASFLLAPAFSMKGLDAGGLIGVDLQTHAIATAQPLLYAGILLGSFAALLLLGSWRRLKGYLMALLFLGGILFFGAYTLTFFLATVKYYLVTTVSLFAEAVRNSSPGDLFIVCWLLLFLAINLFFYIFGFFSFVYETQRD